MSSGNTKRFQYGHPLILRMKFNYQKCNVSHCLKLIFVGKIYGEIIIIISSFFRIGCENNVWVTSSFINIDDEGDKISIVRKGQSFSDDAIIKINPKTGK